MLCTEIVSDIQNNFCTQHVLPMYCKKKSFWQRFTCTRSILGFKDFKVLGICDFACNKLCYVPHPNNYKSRPWLQSFAHSCHYCIRKYKIYYCGTLLTLNSWWTEKKYILLSPESGQGINIVLWKFDKKQNQDPWINVESSLRKEIQKSIIGYSQVSINQARITIVAIV